MSKFNFLIFFLAIVLFASCKDSESTESNDQVVSKTEVKDTKVKESVADQIKKKTELSSGKSNMTVDWLHFDDLVDLDNTENKKYIVDVYTTWCGWCKVMDKQTFADETFQDYISDKYHLVKFNAEQKEPISFRGKKYEWQEGGRKGINALALELLKGRLSYPSLVYLDEDLNKIKVSPGFKKPEQLISELEKLQ